MFADRRGRQQESPDQTKTTSQVVHRLFLLRDTARRRLVRYRSCINAGAGKLSASFHLDHNHSVLRHERSVDLLEPTQILSGPEVTHSCRAPDTEIAQAHGHRHSSPSAVKQPHSFASILQWFHPNSHRPSFGPALSL